MSPLGGSASVSRAVAEAVKLVRASGLPNETNAMFTNVEGPWDEVMGLIRRCCQQMAEDAERVGIVIKVDHRRGAIDPLHTKVASVEQKIVADPR